MDDALKDVMTAQEVADMAGVTAIRIRQLCQQQRLEAIKAAGVWLISRKSALEWMFSPRKTGRPKKDGKSRTST